MGLIDTLLTALFGGGRNVIKETAAIFRPNAEARDQRETSLQGQALAQFGQEFLVPRQGRFDRVMDGINRIPRPALALGTLGLFVAAMVDPDWFSQRMAGIALVPEPLWWLLGAIVSFYFGARHQAKGQAFQTRMAQTLAQSPMAQTPLAGPPRSGTSGALGAGGTGSDAALTLDAVRPAENPALREWARRAD